MKKNIREFGQTFEYLKDPALRDRETDSVLRIENAIFAGEEFIDLLWHDIHFVNCDFVGGYAIKLEGMRDCKFEDCGFAGIMSWGVAHDVEFKRCKVRGESSISDFKGSSHITFEACDFQCDNEDENHWGGIGSSGDATFIGCNFRNFSILVDTKLHLKNCTTKDVHFWSDDEADSGPNFVSCEVLIEDCKMQGRFGFTPAMLTSFTMRNTQFEHIDLDNVTVQGDVWIENVRGGMLDLGVKEGAQRFVLKDSVIHGNGKEPMIAYAGAFQHVLLQNVDFGDRLDATIIGGGYKPDKPQAAMIQSITFDKITAGLFRSARINTANLTITNCTFHRAVFYGSRIDKLTITGTSIRTKLDVTGTQAREQNVQLRKGTGGLRGRIDAIEGSNIRFQKE